MSGYLATLLTQARGTPPEVRLRPKSRFEGERASWLVEETPVEARPAGAVAALERLQSSAPDASTRAAPVPPPSPAPAFATQPGTGPLRETRHERTHTEQRTERVVETHGRVVEHERTVVVHERRASGDSERLAAVRPTATIPPSFVVQPADAVPRSTPVVMAPGVTVAAPTPASTSRLPRPTPGAPRETAAMATRQATRASPMPPDVTIAIGRLDIRLTPSAEATRQATPRAPRVADTSGSLAEYLQRRVRGPA